jgi:hypothetical protein
VRIGDWHVGIRSDRVDTDRLIVAVFGGSLCPHTETPPNLSIRLGGVADRSGATANMHHLVFCACELVGRTRSIRMAAAEVLRRVEEMTWPDDPTVLRLQVCAYIRSGRAILLPRTRGRERARWQAQLRAGGWTQVPGSLVELDIGTGRVVVRRPNLPYDAAALDAICDEWEPPGSVADVDAMPLGAIDVVGWVFVDQTGHDQPLVRPEALIRASGLVTNARTVGRGISLRVLAKVLANSRVTTLPRRTRNLARLVERLVDI